MHRFHYQNKELYCENVALRRVAKAIATPFYLYSKNALLENLQSMQDAFGDVPHLVCYALKANSNETLLKLLARAGAGADVVSGGEIDLALKNGFTPERIVFAGVGKTDEEIRYALSENIYSFHVESQQELEVINDIAESMETVARVGLRVNPNIDIHGHPYISTGRAQDKFGIELQEVQRLLPHMDEYSNVRLIGLHFHNGSQIAEVTPYEETLRVAGELLAICRKKDVQIEYLDIGGGVGVPYENVLSDHPEMLTPGHLIKTLKEDLRSLGLKIVFEPGRSMVAEAGCLVTRILYNKKTTGKQFLIVDASMTELIRPSLYQAYHEILPVKEQGGKEKTYDVVGPVCESGDFLARDRRLPELRRGDLLAVMTAGAYGFSLSSNYNARPRPAEVLVDGESFSVIRERQQVQDLWK